MDFLEENGEVLFLLASGQLGDLRVYFYVSYKKTYVLKWNSKFLLKCQTLDQT